MSAELTWITSHVERCLQRASAKTELEVDEDGDYSYRYGTAVFWVRVQPEPPHFVRVFGYAAHGVRRTAKLLTELNEVNARATTVHAYWVDGLVVVQQTLNPAGVTPETLAEACSAVGHVAADIGSLIAAVHGGTTPLPQLDDVDDPIDEESA